MIEILHNNPIVSIIAICVCLAIFFTSLYIYNDNNKKKEERKRTVKVISFILTLFSFFGTFVSIFSFFVTIDVIPLPISSPKNNIEFIIFSADNDFEQGLYDAAMIKYEEIIKHKDTLFVEQNIHINAQIRKCEQAQKLKKTAETNFNNKKYEQAKIEYRKILDINPKDTFVEKQINECERQIAITIEEQRRKDVEKENRRIAEEAERKRLAEAERKRLVAEAEVEKRRIAKEKLYGNGNGLLTIYSKNPKGGKVSIYIEKELIGILDRYYSSGRPDCGEDDLGVVSHKLKAGYHNVYAKNEDNSEWAFSVYIKEGECELIPLGGE